MKQVMSPFDNVISISDLREDIDSLTRRLVKYPFTIIFKNGAPFFVAVEPAWFKKEVLGKKETKKQALSKRQKTAAYFNKIARRAGDWQAAKVVIEMREQEKKKWARIPLITADTKHHQKPFSKFIVPLVEF